MTWKQACMVHDGMILRACELASLSRDFCSVVAALIDMRGPFNISVICGKMELSRSNDEHHDERALDRQCKNFSRGGQAISALAHVKRRSHRKRSIKPYPTFRFGERQSSRLAPRRVHLAFILLSSHREHRRARAGNLSLNNRKK